MLSIIKKIRNQVLSLIKKRQFDRNATYGTGTKFDMTAGCRNESHNRANIIIGDGSMIRGLITTTGNGRIKIGERLYVGGGTHIGAVECISIGDDVIIAGNTHIYDNNNHPTDPSLRLGMSRSGDFFGPLWSWAKSDHKAIVIEDNVWIGERCAILKGVHIGKGAIVGCNSVVTHDVPPYTIVAGNPARIVKELPH